MTLLDLHAPDRKLWQDRANCLGQDPEFMCPERATQDEVNAAKAVCKGCPVFDQCQDSAESQASSDGVGAFGVWAGKWWGDLPTEPLAPCKQCGGPIEEQGRRRREFCNVGCRKKWGNDHRKNSSA